MKYKHIVWDWNGTLLDDRWLCIEAINCVLKSRNMPLVSKKIPVILI
jgi:phosphoglycolate phosphatase